LKSPYSIVTPSSVARNGERNGRTHSGTSSMAASSSSFAAAMMLISVDSR